MILDFNVILSRKTEIKSDVGNCDELGTWATDSGYKLKEFHLDVGTSYWTSPISRD